MSALLAALSGPAPWQRAAYSDDSAGTAADGPVIAGFAGADLDPEAEEEAYQEAVAAGRVGELPLDVVAGRVAESLPAGPGLAGWLAQARAADLEDGALAGVAVSFRRLASWAAAGELAAVAQIASRSAQSDRHAEVDPLGRPDRVTADAAGQVALALAMSQDGASGWTDLAVVLTWRLPATGAALAAGEIDLSRARMIARMTSPLSEEAARKVEAAVLDRAGWQTLGQLHAALRRAVVKADPEGAERRREDAERRAKVVLYPEDEGTATLSGYCLPGVHAAAAMARITALAKAMRAAGTSGGVDLVRAQVFLGLLLGTLPYLPPAPGAPPEVPPDDGSPPDASPGDDGAQAGWPDRGSEERESEERGSEEYDDLDDVLHGEAGPWPGVPPIGLLAGLQPTPRVGGLLNLTVPFATLAGTSAAPGQLSRLGVITAGQARQLAALAAQHPATRWRIVVTTPAGQAIAVTHLPRDRAGPTRLPRDRGSPGDGPRPACSAVSSGIGLTRRVTLAISTDALSTDALSAGGLSAGGPSAGGPSAGGPSAGGPSTGGPSTGGPSAGGLVPEAGSPLAVILDRARDAAVRVADQAVERAREDARGGGCAHGLASVAYRPPPRIAELVTARDGTCRFGPCRRPAEQCDLDHTIPFDQGGLTCSCNVGGQCRSHHQLKQHPGWTLTQPAPGVFQWTTPVGRTYTVCPDPFG